MRYYDKTKKWFVIIEEDFRTSPQFEELRKINSEYCLMFVDLIFLTKNSNGIFENNVGRKLVPIDFPEISRKLSFYTPQQIKNGMMSMAELGLLQVFEERVLSIADFDNFIRSKTIGSIQAKEQRDRKKEKRIELNPKKIGCVEEDIQKADDAIKFVDKL